MWILSYRDSDQVNWVHNTSYTFFLSNLPKYYRIHVIL